MGICCASDEGTGTSAVVVGDETQKEAPNDSKAQDTSKASSNSSGPPPATEMRPIPENEDEMTTSSAQGGSGTWPLPGVDHATKLPPLPSGTGSAPLGGRDGDMSVSNPGNPVCRKAAESRQRGTLASKSKKNWTFATVDKMRRKSQGMDGSMVSDSSFADSSLISKESGNSLPPDIRD